MFSQHNLHTVMGTAQASAAAVLAAAEAGLPVAWHTPTEVKAAVTGTGRADKAQVAGMVVRILRLETAPKPVDATDALALAICHVWRGAAMHGSRRRLPPRRPHGSRRGSREQESFRGPARLPVRLGSACGRGSR